MERQQNNQNNKIKEALFVLNNPFINELEKFKKADVVVHYYDSDGNQTIEGQMRGIDYGSKAVIIMTEDEKIFIPRYIKIHRKRKPET